MHEDLQLQRVVQPLELPEIVAFPEEVDITNSETVTTGLLAAFRPGVAVVIADLSDTVFCDSMGIRCLLLASNQAVSTATHLRVVVGEGMVRRALHVSGADQRLALYPDLQAALTGAPAPAAPTY